ncbi:MAG: hypothetical protein AAGU27_22990 [Dehalobacterium sp.]
MKASSVFLILRDNSFICKKTDDSRSFVFKFNDIKNMPNVPFYHQIWNDSAKYIKLYKNFYKNEVMYNSIISSFLKYHAYVAIPDDALEVDRKIVIEFLLQCGSKSVRVTPECMLIGRHDDAYIVLSRTSRMIVLSYVLDGKVAHQQYLERNDYSVEELKSYISMLLNNRELGKIPVYLNGEKMDQYSGLGFFVEPESILENYIRTENRSSRN